MILMKIPELPLISMTHNPFQSLSHLAPHQEVLLAAGAQVSQLVVTRVIGCGVKRHWVAVTPMDEHVIVHVFMVTVVIAIASHHP